MNHYLLQSQLICLPVTAAQLQGFIQRYIQHICSQRLQTKAIIYSSLPENRDRTEKDHLQFTYLNNKHAKGHFLEIETKLYLCRKAR